MPPSRGTNPATKSIYGFITYLRGIRWLSKNKKHMFMLFLPTVLGLIALAIGWGYFFANDTTLIAMVLPDKPEAWYWLVIYWLGYAITYIGFLALSAMTCLLITNVVTSPIYDLVSAAVERDLTGKVEEVSLARSLVLMGEEVKKVLFILSISIVSFLVTSFIPGASIISLLLTAFLIGWDFYDYPLARRGWKFKERLAFVTKDAWAVTAFGLWLIIPFLQFILMPLAIAGGTIITVESLAKSKPSPTKAQSYRSKHE